MAAAYDAYGAAFTSGGSTAGSVNSSAKKSQTLGKPVQAVYGTAAVEGVLLTKAVPGGRLASVQLDGITADDMDVAEVQIGLAFGPVASVDGIIYEKRLYGPSAITNHQLDDIFMGASGFPPEYTLGDPATATTWSLYSGSAYEAWRVPYGNVALFRCGALGCPQNYSSLGTLKGVVRGHYASHRNTAREDLLGGVWDIYDANPADVITDLIENGVYGLGFPAGTVVTSVGADGLAASSYRTYCTAYSFWIALGIDKTVKVKEVVAMILQATNSIGFWDGDPISGQMTFRVVPLGDAAKTANGVTYTPVLTALEIDDDHIVRDGENPVLVRTRPISERFNVVPVEWSRDTATRDIELVTAEIPDIADQNANGRRRSDPVSLPCIRSLAHAQECSRILGNRSLYNFATYEFTVTPRAAATIQVGDLLSIVHVPMALNGKLVRVTETDENARGDLRVRAVEWHTGSGITITTLPRLEDGA